MNFYLISDSINNFSSLSATANGSAENSASGTSSKGNAGAPETDPITKENPGMFDLDSKTFVLNGGHVMPINGLGTYSLTGDTYFESVTSALQNGVRLIDTVYMYGNNNVTPYIQSLGIHLDVVLKAFYVL